MEVGPLWVLVDDLGRDLYTVLVEFKGSAEQRGVTTT